MTVLEFIKIYQECHFFFKEFVYGFVARDRDDVCMKVWKIISPTRDYKSMQQKTKEFVSSIDELMARKPSTKIASLFLMKQLLELSFLYLSLRKKTKTQFVEPPMQYKHMT